MIASMSSGFLFHPDATEAPTAQVVGRRVAGSALLQAYIQYAPGTRTSIVTRSVSDERAFLQLARDQGWANDWDLICLQRGDDFTRVGTLFLPDPSFGELPWLRRMRDPRSVSIVGMNHTLSTRRVSDSLRELILAPTESWDALICTSQASRAAVLTQLESYGSYFAQRFQAERMPAPRLPVIPLGVDADRFSDPTPRDAIRAAHGVARGDLVVLAVGRVSSVEKAHLVPLLQVLARILPKVAHKVHLWCFGWSANDDETALLRDATQAICPDLQLSLVDGTDDALRRSIWAAADLFTLPTDSIQETFGLVALEAMAAGLPVVMPDWDGLRDTVIPNETGFLIPTRMARPGSGQIVAERHATGVDTYREYLSLVQQQVAIDQRQYGAALLALLTDPDLRQRMGKNGQHHVRDAYAWRSIIGKWHALAAELYDARRRAPIHSLRPSSGSSAPFAMDPFDSFAGYASGHLRPESVVALAGPFGPAQMDALEPHTGRAIYRRWVVPNELIVQVADRLATQGAQNIAALCLAFEDVAPTNIESAILIMSKYGIVHIDDP